MNEHPSFDITGSLGTELSGSLIVLAVTGSVAAVQTPELARLLMRHGAEVQTVMTRAARRILHPDALHWATGRSPIVKLGGAIEHVSFCGNVDDKADLLLIAPATANTIGKIACGIDDTPVTTFATTAIGEGIPVVIVPAMHESMYHHPAVIENIARLEKMGVRVLASRIEEGKAKIPASDDILNAVLGILGPRRLAGKRVLVTAGRTVEFIDPVRVITNNSTGRMGCAIADACRAEGAEVVLICGKISVEPPGGAGIRVVRTDTAEALAKAVHDELAATPCDIVFAAAAVGDWKLARPFEHKVPTEGVDKLVVELVPTPKILDGLRDIAPRSTIVAFRAVEGLSEADRVEDAKKRLKKARADLIFSNEVGLPDRGFEAEGNAFIAVDRKGKVSSLALAHKRDLARKIVDVIVDFGSNKE